MVAGLGGQREGGELEIGVQRLHGRNDPDALNNHSRFAVGESVQRLVVVGAHGVFLSVAVQLQEFLGGLFKSGVVGHSGFAVVDGAVDGLIIVHAVQGDHGPHRAGLPVHVVHHEGGDTGGLQLFAHGDQLFIGGGHFDAVFFENLLVIENAGGVHGDGQDVGLAFVQGILQHPFVDGGENVLIGQIQQHTVLGHFLITGISGVVGQHFGQLIGSRTGLQHRGGVGNLRLLHVDVGIFGLELIDQRVQNIDHFRLDIKELQMNLVAALGQRGNASEHQHGAKNQSQYLFHGFCPPNDYLNSRRRKFLTFCATSA